MLEDHVETHGHYIVRAIFERAGGHEEDRTGLDEAVDFCRWVVFKLD